MSAISLLAISSCISTLSSKIILPYLRASFGGSFSSYYMINFNILYNLENMHSLTVEKYILLLVDFFAFSFLLINFFF